MNKPAGQDSPHLDEGQQAQAAQHSAPEALVIHEVLRKEGEDELQKPTSSVLWSGLSAGLSMGFSFLGLALLRGLLPDAPWSRMIYAAGYTVGFCITVLGRQELFTESTLTAMLPLLVKRDAATLKALLRFWITVLVANMVGTALFAALLSVHGLFDTATLDAMRKTSEEISASPALPSFVKSIFAGWIIALMAWVLPAAKSSRLPVILLLTYVVALGGFPHIVAGSVEAAYHVMNGGTIADYLLRFFLPTILGNTFGGVALVALLNHAPLASELQGEKQERKALRRKQAGDAGAAK